MAIENKPQGCSGYGSIGHLPGSKLGPTDSKIPEGQAAIATVKTRDRHDVVIVQEKTDGSGTGVARVDNEIYPLTRAGFLASTSQYEHHQRFAEWAYENKNKFLKLLKNGETARGECLLATHGIRYKLKHEPFVLFDITVKKERVCYDELLVRASSDFVLPSTVHVGGALSVEDAMSRIHVKQADETYGGHGAIDLPEGAIYRVERKQRLLFITKYVRSDFEPGKYLSEMTGQGTVWNEKI